MGTKELQVEDLCDISIWKIRKKILKMIIPIILEGVLQMSAGFISMAMTGKLNATSIAALGLSVRITQIIWAFFKGIAIGATIFVAQAYGANDRKKLRNITMQTLVSSVVIVIVVQQILFWFAPFIVSSIFSAEDILVQTTVTHLRTVSFGLPFLVIMLIAGGIMQATGDALTPLIVAFIMNIINVIFSYLFIFGGMGISSMGVKGAAIGLAISQTMAAIMYLYIFFRKRGLIGSSKIRKFKLDLSVLKQIYKVALPASVEAVFLQIAVIIVTNVVLGYGENQLAAYQLGVQAEGMFFTPAMGFGVAATAFIGQSLGANNTKLAKAYMKEICLETVLVTSISVVVLVLFPENLMGLLTDKKELIEIGALYLIVTGLIQIPQNIGIVIIGAIRGAGYSKSPMVVSALGIWGVRVLGALVFGSIMKLDIIWVWIAIDVDLLIRLISSYIVYKKINIYENPILL
ncbi:MAG: MATE family efflux transporter [Clostridium sp.]